MDLSKVKAVIQNVDRGLRARNDVSHLHDMLVHYHAVLRHLEPKLERHCIESKRVSGRARKSRHSIDVCAQHLEVVDMIRHLEQRLGFFGG
jgi:hypothetical protein